MLEELRTFLAVSEVGNFSIVARKLNVAVSSITRKIDALEAQVGVKLFRRGARQIMLTDAGEQFGVSARRILAEFDEVKDLLNELQSEPSGTLAVTAPTSFGQRYVLPVVTQFLRQYPQIQIDLHLNDSWVDLASQRMDVAIRIGSLPDSDLVATHLAPMRRLICASPLYLDRHGYPDQLLDILKHQCLTVATTPAPLGLWSFSGIKGGQPLPVKGPLRTNDIEALMRAAEDGLGIVHLASWLLRDSIAAGRLVQLFPDANSPSKSTPSAIHAVRLPGRSHKAKAQLFIEHLKQSFGDGHYWDQPAQFNKNEL